MRDLAGLHGRRFALRQACGQSNRLEFRCVDKMQFPD